MRIICRVLQVTTLNLNGIRAAFRKGLAQWLQIQKPDILCVQELKAQQKDISAEMATVAGLQGYFSYAERPGYSGVGIYSRQIPQAVSTTFGDSAIDSEGRFIQLDFPTYSIVSLYVPSGTSGEARQQVKYQIMERVAQRFAEYRTEAANSGREFIICADWNIAHTQKDIRNWRANQKKSGFLPEERQWISTQLADGWVDVFRQLNDNEDEYTWWSNRGNAWANNVGWRLDYQLATAGLAQQAESTAIYKDERFSDHAPLTICYNFL